ncbi:hypothetical protein [Fusobacterium necrophorum]|uniref:hypothetical protein n=1 Tax=Fusobacterium necrophorum TaxID=859 RepID=UPI0007898156|nr:hypothetical protein [Fusobacterium necrophorum]KYM46988.1 hypothetical protein A2U08_09120 [Fusobacterium necrophorum subsp. funduliforme]
MEKLLSLLERQGISIEKKNVILAQLKEGNGEQLVFGTQAYVVIAYNEEKVIKARTYFSTTAVDLSQVEIYDKKEVKLTLNNKARQGELVLEYSNGEKEQYLVSHDFLKGLTKYQVAATL